MCSFAETSRTKAQNIVTNWVSISLCTCNYVCVWCFFELWFFSNHFFETISDTDLTSDYKYFLGARLAKYNNTVKTCAFRMPGYRSFNYNVNAKCYDIDISRNKTRLFLKYDFTKIVPKNKIEYSKYQSTVTDEILEGWIYTKKSSNW